MSFIQTQLVLSLFAMVFLTFTVLLTLAVRRRIALKKRELDLAFYRLYQDGREPDKIRQTARNLINLFEVPILFYSGIMLTLVLNIQHYVLIYFAWAYVILRYIHSFVHCTNNHFRARFYIFVISSFILMGYWITLFVLFAS
ncbi:MAPEG family protein [Aliikangiella sp. IMCC44359]|uniref:MAPEG family protein n=1 Tax=Aliikangiella sp. IMCC44359 TaxID=3459125 RepID=UPI00403ABB86